MSKTQQCRQVFTMEDALDADMNANAVKRVLM